jgi:formylglycine-generating enzyme required for sulfatase activity
VTDPTDPQPGHEHDPEEIVPVTFRPSSAADAPADRPRRRLLGGVLWAAGLALAVLAWFIFTAVPVHIETTPAGADISLPRTLLEFSLDDRFLVRPGTHRIRAALTGYHVLDTTIAVDARSGQVFTFTLSKLPGRLRITATPVPSAQVLIDDTDIGETPMLSPELPAGLHDIEIVAERYQPFSARIDVEGGGVEQPLDVVLNPDWAAITLSTTPPGATLEVDGAEVGITPGSFDLLSGERELRVVLDGYNPWTHRLVVEAEQPQTLAGIVLEEADAQLELTTEPPGAQVSLGATYQGVTPLTVPVPPESPQDVKIFKPGYEVIVRSVELRPGQQERMHLPLQARLGVIDLISVPEDAELTIDGRPAGAATQQLTLIAVPHQLVIRKDGYAPHEVRVTPRPDAPQSLEITLQTEAQHRVATRSTTIRTARGQQLALVPGGTFTMGSSRRDRARRANEVLRPVELTRPYYLGVKEITNREFRQFAPAHGSGSAGGHDLNADAQPVTSVSWEQAARFCNWLSAQDSLPPAYEERGGTLGLVHPIPSGYRLPTEAEWAWAARFTAGGGERYYIWGDALPPPPGAGNFADSSAAGFLSHTLSAFTDGFPVAAPAGSGTANPLGLWNLGDNVAEWVHDFYTIYPEGSPRPARDPTGPSSGQLRVVRGPSWKSRNTTELRLAYRGFAGRGDDHIGFRIARYAD